MPEAGERSAGPPAIDTLEGVAVTLRELARHDEAGLRQVLLDLIARVASPGNLRTLLRRIDSDPEVLAVVAKRSFRHRNYFDKVVLLDDETGGAYRLTLHLWRPPFSERELADDHIHDHRCEFWSAVLFGSLVSEEFARSEEGERFREVRYRPDRTRHGAKVNAYEPAGWATLRRTATRRHAAGSTYFLPRERIHRVAISPSEATATLVANGPHRTEVTSLFSNTRTYEDAVLTPFDVPALRERLDFVGTNLS